MRILAKRENSFLKEKGSKLPRDNAPEVPAASDHSRVVVGIAHVLDAPGRSGHQAVSEITGFMHCDDYRLTQFGIPPYCCPNLSLFNRAERKSGGESIQPFSQMRTGSKLVPTGIMRLATASTFKKLDARR